MYQWDWLVRGDPQEDMESVVKGLLCYFIF